MPKAFKKQEIINKIYKPIVYRAVEWNLLCTEPHSEVTSIKSDDGWYSKQWNPYSLQKLCVKTINVNQVPVLWPKHLWKRVVQNT